LHSEGLFVKGMQAPEGRAAGSEMGDQDDLSDVHGCVCCG
jgi:hypothetical protein